MPGVALNGLDYSLQVICGHVRVNTASATVCYCVHPDLPHLRRRYLGREKQRTGRSGTDGHLAGALLPMDDIQQLCKAKEVDTILTLC